MELVDLIVANENANRNPDDINAQNFRKLGVRGQTLRDIVLSGEPEDLVVVAFLNISRTEVSDWQDLRVYTPAVLCSMVHSHPDHWFVKYSGTAENDPV